MLNSRHKATGEVFEQAIAVMTTLNAQASRQALAAGIRCATDVTGFGLLGHLYKLARASGVTAVIDRSAVPLIDGAAAALRDGLRARREPAQPGLGRPRTPTSATPAEDDLLLLADAQTSGGLLVAGEVPGAPVIGELVPRGDAVLVIR